MCPVVGDGFQRAILRVRTSESNAADAAQAELVVSQRFPRRACSAVSEEVRLPVDRFRRFDARLTAVDGDRRFLAVFAVANKVESVGIASNSAGSTTIALIVIVAMTTAVNPNAARGVEWS